MQWSRRSRWSRRIRRSVGIACSLGGRVCFGGFAQAPPAGRVVGRPSSCTDSPAGAIQTYVGHDEQSECDEGGCGDEVHGRGDGGLPVVRPPRPRQTHRHRERRPHDNELGHRNDRCYPSNPGVVRVVLSPLTTRRRAVDDDHHDAGQDCECPVRAEQADLLAPGAEQAQEGGACDQCAQSQRAQCQDSAVAGWKGGIGGAGVRSAHEPGSPIGAGAGMKTSMKTGTGAEFGVSGVTILLCD